jgi:protein SCO1/2
MQSARNRLQSKKLLAWVLSVAGIMFALTVYQLGSPAGLSKVEARQIGLIFLDEPRGLDPVSLTQDSGEVFTTADFEGQWNVLFFGFTHCPDICPTTMATLASAKAGAEHEFPQVWLVTVDPQRDTPDQLDLYLKEFDSAFTGITGEIQEIKALAKQVYVTVGHMPDVDSTGYNVDHGSSLVLVDSSGRHAGYIRSPHSVANLLTIIKNLPSN